MRKNCKYHHSVVSIFQESQSKLKFPKRKVPLRLQLVDLVKSEIHFVLNILNLDKSWIQIPINEKNLHGGYQDLKNLPIAC